MQWLYPIYCSLRTFQNFIVQRIPEKKSVGQKVFFDTHYFEVIIQNQNIYGKFHSEGMNTETGSDKQRLRFVFPYQTQDFTFPIPDLLDF